MTETTEFISDWLQEPHLLSEQEQAQLAAILEKYPYFVPAQYAAAGDQYNKASGFSAAMLHNMQLYSGNWLLFYEQMKKSTREKVVRHPPVSPAAIPEPLIEPDTIPGLVQPVSADNYFLHQGIDVPDEIPAEMDHAAVHEQQEEDEKSLMVMMGFDEWLNFLKRKNDRKRSDEEDKAMLKAMWQKEKLAAAMGEEDEEIPEAVFEMAINSIDKEEALVSESLAEIHVKQGKHEKAIEIYRKLSLQNPQKKAYFAAKIDNLIKEKQS